MRIVHPTPAEASVAEAYSAPLGGPHDGRPWVQLCMVSSLDGSTVVDGTSGALSSPNDTAVLAQLRSLAEVVLVGAGTAAGEGYGPPKTPGQRIGVVTRSGSVDLDTDLYRSGAGFVVTTTQTDIDTDGFEGDLDVIRAGDDDVDLVEAVTQVGHRFGARVIQAEGGPRLNAALAEADLIDELALTTSPGIVAGDGPRLTRGGSPTERAYELVQLAIDDDQFVFQRWRRRR